MACFLYPTEKEVIYRMNNDCNGLASFFLTEEKGKKQDESNRKK